MATFHGFSRWLEGKSYDWQIYVRAEASTVDHFRIGSLFAGEYHTLVAHDSLMSAITGADAMC